jgi:hypothetical protein
MLNQQPDMVDRLTPLLVQVISETNGINLDDTLELLCINRSLKADVELYDEVQAFRRNLWRFHQDEIPVSELLDSCIAGALFQFLKNFPLPYHEEHIHLTGSLSAEFIFPRLQALLAGPGRLQLEQKIVEVYGEQALPINSIEDVENLITLKEGELFSTYLQILYLAKTILISREVHREAAYHMASTLYEKYNVGKIRLKFTLARSSGISSEQIPGAENVTEADVVLGLYDGFMDFQRSHPFFEFILSPSFRKEAQFYDQEHYASKTEHFSHQVNSILTLLDNHPELKPHLCEVDTVGDEKNFYRKAHFQEMKRGLRKLQDSVFGSEVTMVKPGRPYVKVFNPSITR